MATEADIANVPGIAAGDFVTYGGGTTLGKRSPAETAALPELVAAFASNAAATTAASGLVELATSAETQTGTDAARAVTPAAAAATYLPLTQAVRTITGTSDTLVLADANRQIRTTNGATVTITVPTNASVAFPTNTRIDLRQMGAGRVDVTGAPGVTVNRIPGYELSLGGQYAEASLVKDSTDVWVLTGVLEAS